MQVKNRELMLKLVEETIATVKNNLFVLKRNKITDYASNNTFFYIHRNLTYSIENKIVIKSISEKLSFWTHVISMW
jgi:hypothetical protein